MPKMPEILAIIGGGKRRGAGPEMEMEDEEEAPASSKASNEEKLGLADELLTALSKKDRQGVADALEAFVMCCGED